MTSRTLPDDNQTKIIVKNMSMTYSEYISMIRALELYASIKRLRTWPSDWPQLGDPQFMADEYISLFMDCHQVDRLCECGSDKAMVAGHSSWCPKYLD